MLRGRVEVEQLSSHLKLDMQARSLGEVVRQVKGAGPKKKALHGGEQEDPRDVMMELMKKETAEMMVLPGQHRTQTRL